MPPPVYTERLAQFRALESGNTHEAQPPGGHIFVVRCIDILLYGYPNISKAAVLGPLGQTIFQAELSIHAYDPAEGEYGEAFNGRTVQWTGRQVIYPEETLGVACLRGTIDLTVSGWVLSEPPA